MKILISITLAILYATLIEEISSKMLVIENTDFIYPRIKVHKRFVHNSDICRRLCEGNEKCTVYSIKERLRGGLICRMLIDRPVLTKEDFKSSQRTTTYIYENCREGQIDLEDAGCVFISQNTSTFHDSKSSCPKGTKFYSPQNPDEYQVFRNELLNLKEEDPSVPNDIWINVHKLANNSTWRFNPDWTFVIRRVGQFPFGPNEYPDSNEEQHYHARLSYKPEDGYFYHLSTQGPNIKYHFMCIISLMDKK